MAGATEARAVPPNDRTKLPDGWAARSDGRAILPDGCAVRMDDRTELRVGWAMRMDRPAIPPDDGAVPSDACAVSPDEWLVRTDGRRDAPLTAERIRQTTVVKVEVVIAVNPGNRIGV